MKLSKWLCIVLITIVAGCGEDAPQFVVDQSTDKQQARLAEIDKLRTDGYILKVTFADNGPVTWVTEKFIALSPAEMAEHVTLIHTYGYNPKRGLFSVRLKHHKTGAEIGEYHPDTGLQLR